MLPFKLFETKKQKTHFVNKNGRVVLLHTLGDKHGHERVKGKKRKLKEDWRESHFSDADENIGDIGKYTGATGLNEYEFNEATTLSDKLHKTLMDNGGVSDQHQTWLKNYTKASMAYNKSLINSHKNGTEPFAEHPESVRQQLQKQHDAIMSNTHSPLQTLHLYSGTPHDFGEMAKQSKDGVIHSPAPISASHDINVARHFARQAAGHASDKPEHDVDAHMVHVHVKPHQKILHMSGMSDFPAEHETLIPPGAKLKYSHSTEHFTPRELGVRGSPKRKVNIHHFEIMDHWHKDTE